MFIKIFLFVLKLVFMFLPFLIWLRGIMWASNGKYNNPESADLYTIIEVCFTVILFLFGLWINAQFGFTIFAPSMAPEV